jgi:hypothetical protein
MGANFVSYKRTGTRDEIRKWFDSEQEQDRFENGHCYSGGIGMARGLRFVEGRTFKDEAEAEEWICDNAQKWEEALAVKMWDAVQPMKAGQPCDTWMIGAWCAS